MRIANHGKSIVSSSPSKTVRTIVNYAEYLLEKHKKSESSQKEIEQVHSYGSWAGQIIMSDDFDE